MKLFGFCLLIIAYSSSLFANGENTSFTHYNPEKPLALEMVYTAEQTRDYQNFEQDDGSIKTEKVNAIMVIEAQGDKFTYLDPDGVERSYWLNRIGLLSDKEFQAEAVKLKLKDDRKKLYKLLRQEYGE